LVKKEKNKQNEASSDREDLVRGTGLIREIFVRSSFGVPKKRLYG